VTLWRLELIRLFRSLRWVILVAVYGFFGVIGPLTARFLPDLIESIEGSTAGLPEFGPPDGITQFVGNAQQFGILAVAFVAAAALAIDSNVELAVFFRTRAPMRDLLPPRLVVNAAAAGIAFSLGALIAYIGTGILLDWIDLGPFIVGVVLQCVYLAFAVAIVGLMASLVRKVVTTALLSVAVLILLGVLTLVSPIAPWLPSNLAGAIDQLIRGGEFDFWRSLVVTVVLIASLSLLSIRRLDRREV
jgi:ABC-2 type transport system permease protein